MIPLKETCDTQDPILELQEVNVLFGPIENIISCHELFYLALSSKTAEWAEGHTIGDSILSSVSVQHMLYSANTLTMTSFDELPKG